MSPRNLSRISLLVSVLALAAVLAFACKDDQEEGTDCGSVCSRVCETPVCIEDKTCDLKAGETCSTCAVDCGTCSALCANGEKDEASKEEGIDCGGLCPNKCEKVCVPNNKCETDLVAKGLAKSNENSENCAQDCYCGDGTCDEKESATSCPKDCQGTPTCGDGTCDATEDSTSCPADCKVSEGSSPSEGEEGGFPWVLVISVLLVLLIGGLLAYFYLQGFFGPRRGGQLKLNYPRPPSYRQAGEARQPPTLGRYLPSRNAPESKMETELERSIGKASRIIKKQ